MPIIFNNRSHSTPLFKSGVFFYFSREDLEFVVGLVCYERKQFQLAVHYWKKALEEAKKLEHVDTFLKADILNFLGDAQGRVKWKENGNGNAGNYFEIAGAQ